MKGIAGALERDPQLEALVRDRHQELGLADGSRLDRVLREPTIERAIEQSVARHRGLGISR